MRKKNVLAAFALGLALAGCGASDGAAAGGPAVEEFVQTQPDQTQPDQVQPEQTPPEALALEPVVGGYDRSLPPGEDLDGDGVPNAFDVLPNDPSEGWDTDGDLIGDNSDSDDDNDGIPDVDDAFPTDHWHWSDIDEDGLPDSLDWEITGDRGADELISSRASYGLSTNLDTAVAYSRTFLDTRVTPEELEYLERSWDRYENENAMEILEWAEGHPSHIGTRVQLNGGGFVVVASSSTRDELIADGLPIETLDDPSVLRFETRPFSRTEIGLGLEDAMARLAEIEAEHGLRISVNIGTDNRVVVGAQFEEHPDLDLELVDEAEDVLNEWRDTIEEPWRSIVRVEESSVLSGRWEEINQALGGQ